MNTKTDILRAMVVSALLASGCLAGNAHAVYENEPNNSIGAAQKLPPITGGAIQVTGSIGVTAPNVAAVVDDDFYSFEGVEGDVISIDIDDGMKLTGSGTRSVDTVIALFSPGPTYQVLMDNDDAPDKDLGSISRYDSRIDNYRLPVTGTYTIAVGSYPRLYLSGGALSTRSRITNTSTPNGRYTLVVTPVYLTAQMINIEIKPGSGTIAPINPKARGNVPVALLSSAEFDALAIDRSSITFGSTGSEASLLRCGRDGEDVNGDGRLDLVCHFDNQAASFEPDDSTGILRGRLPSGRPFEGRGYLKVIPVKLQHGE